MGGCSPGYVRTMDLALMCHLPLLYYCATWCVAHIVNQLLGKCGFALREFHKHNFSKRTQIYVLNTDSFTYTYISTQYILTFHMLHEIRVK